MTEVYCCLYCGRDTTAKCKICGQCRDCSEHMPPKDTDPIKWSALEYWGDATPYPPSKDES